MEVQECKTWEDLADELRAVDHYLRHSTTLQDELTRETALEIDGWCRQIAATLDIYINNYQSEKRREK